MPNLVIVEPDIRLANLYKSSLEIAHPSISVALVHDAQSALHVIEQFRPQLVLLELDMAVHSGFEFLYEFISYEDWRSIPVAVLSRLPKSYFASMTADWSELGVVDYLYKADTSLHLLQQRVGELLMVPSTER